MNGMNWDYLGYTVGIILSLYLLRASCKRLRRYAKNAKMRRVLNIDGMDVIRLAHDDLKNLLHRRYREEVELLNFRVVKFLDELPSSPRDRDFLRHAREIVESSTLQLGINNGNLTLGQICYLDGGTGSFYQRFELNGVPEDLMCDLRDLLSINPIGPLAS